LEAHNVVVAVVTVVVILAVVILAVVILAVAAAAAATAAAAAAAAGAAVAAVAAVAVAVASVTATVYKSTESIPVLTYKQTQIKSKIVKLLAEHHQCKVRALQTPIARLPKAF
jgi:sugar (pentulose or hexulose) kinase